MNANTDDEPKLQNAMFCKRSKLNDLAGAQRRKYSPTKAVPPGCSEHYSAGWLYADWWLSKGGSQDADSPDGWPYEKYEGWWDRLGQSNQVAVIAAEQ